MIYLPDSVKRIALTGANVVIDANDYLPETVHEIISAAKSVGANISILNASRYLPATTEGLARAGGKNVTVYLSNH